MKPPKLEMTGTSTAVSYHFKAVGEGAGSCLWAICTVNDRTGELQIMSDSANFSFRWNTGALGTEQDGTRTTLMSFVRDSDIDYLASKLNGRGEVLDACATVRSLRKLLCQRRLVDGRAGRAAADGDPPWRRRYVGGGLPDELIPLLDERRARKIWGDMDELEELDGRDDLFWERVWGVDGLSNYVTSEPWNYAEKMQTNEDRILRESILPALKEACRGRSP